MKILKTEDIKTVIVKWLRTVYTDGYEIESSYHYTSVRMKDVGSVDLQFLRRRHIRVKGATGEQLVGGGVSFNGRRDGSMLLHGGAKSDFGVFDEVELKRKIDFRFKAKIEEREARKKSEQAYTNKCQAIDPILVAYGYQPDGGYTWQKTWEYDKKIRVTLRQGGGLTLGILNSTMNEEELLKLAKGFKEILSGELTSNTI